MEMIFNIIHLRDCDNEDSLSLRNVCIFPRVDNGDWIAYPFVASIRYGNKNGTSHGILSQ